MSLFNPRNNYLSLVATLVVATVLAAPTQSQAAFRLTLTDTNGPGVPVVVTGPDAAGASYTGSVGDFSIVIAFGASNSPGSANAMTQVGSIIITNTSGTAQTLTIEATAQNFNSPQSPPPLVMADTVSGSVLSGSLITGTFQGFADASNAQGGHGFAGQLLTFGPKGAGSSFAKDGILGGFSPDGATYSMTVFESFTLSGGGTLTLTGGNAQLTAVPAPAGIVLMLTSLPVVMGYWASRRRKERNSLAS